MKKSLICFLLCTMAVAALFLFSACNGNNNKTPEETAAPTEAVSEETSDIEATEAPENTDNTDNTENPEVEETATAEPSATPYVEPESASEDFPLPKDSSAFSKATAAKAILLASGHLEDVTKGLFEADGFTVVYEKNYDKADDDASHTCAYMLAKKAITFDGSEKDLYFLTVRGTNRAEWFSNLDFMPSGDYSSQFSENFLLCAQDVYNNVKSLIPADSLLLISGHSRGAATSNLLGMLFNESRDSKLTYVYTFATPTTVQKGTDTGYTGNIFNLINPCDLVTTLPLESLGFERLGTDIILEKSDEDVAELQKFVEILDNLAPTISDYYNKKYSLKQSGTDEENGFTVYEVFTLMAKAYLGVTSMKPSEAADFLKLTTLSESSDLYPLFSNSSLLMGEDGIASSVVFQHLPTTYEALLNGTEPSEDSDSAE